MVVAAESIVEYELFLLLVYNGVDINATSGDEGTSSLLSRYDQSRLYAILPGV